MSCGASGWMIASAWMVGVAASDRARPIPRAIVVENLLMSQDLPGLIGGVRTPNPVGRAFPSTRRPGGLKPLDPTPAHDGRGRWRPNRVGRRYGADSPEILSSRRGPAADVRGRVALPPPPVN